MGKEEVRRYCYGVMTRVYFFPLVEAEGAGEGRLVFGDEERKGEREREKTGERNGVSQRDGEINGTRERERDGEKETESSPRVLSPSLLRSVRDCVALRGREQEARGATVYLVNVKLTCTPRLAAKLPPAEAEKIRFTVFPRVLLVVGKDGKVIHVEERVERRMESENALPAARRTLTRCLIRMFG